MTGVSCMVRPIAIWLGALISACVAGNKYTGLTALHGPGQASLDAFDQVDILTGGKAHCLAAQAGAAGAAGAMDVGLGGIRHVVVDHMGNPGNINAPGSDICCHQHLEPAALEAVHSLFTHVLGKIALQGSGIKTGMRQFGCQAFGLVLGAGENQGRQHSFVAQKLHEKRCFFGLLKGIEAMGNGLHRAIRADLHPHWFLQNFLCQCTDTIRHGGREQEGLFLERQLPDNALQIRQKALVEHVICLVEHQAFHLFEADGAIMHDVEHAARAGNNNINPALDALDLGLFAHPAIDGQNAQMRALDDAAGKGGDLLGQFPGRRKYQGAWLFGFCLDKRVQKRQHVGRCLAGAGLGQTDNVPTCQNRRNGLCLNGGRLGKTTALDCRCNPVV